MAETLLLQHMGELFAASAAQPAKQTATKAAAPAKQAQQAASDAVSSPEKPSRDLLGNVFSGIRLPWQQGNGAKQQQVMPSPFHKNTKGNVMPVVLSVRRSPELAFEMTHSGSASLCLAMSSAEQVMVAEKQKQSKLQNPKALEQCCDAILACHQANKFTCCS